MKILHIIDKTTKKETYMVPIMVPEPFDFLFVKDRKTKVKYLLIRTHGEDPYEGHKQYLEVPYDQYSNVSLETEEIK